VPAAPATASLVSLSSSRLKIVWSAPGGVVDSGGATVTAYRVEWDTSASFANVVTGGYFATVTDLAPGAGLGPFFYNFPVFTAGAYHARVRAINDRGSGPWASSAAGDFATATPVNSVPGAPQSVAAVALSGQQIRVTWAPPSDALAAFGGNGGAPILRYQVQFATSFGGGATITTQLHTDLTSLVEDIGARDPLTGVVTSPFPAGQAQVVRVYAENALGSGAMSAAVAVTPVDTVPTAPLSVSAAPTAVATELLAAWAPPAADGGASLEQFKVEWDPAAGLNSLDVVTVTASAALNAGQFALMSGTAPIACVAYNAAGSALTSALTAGGTGILAASVSTSATADGFGYIFTVTYVNPVVPTVRLTVKADQSGCTPLACAAACTTSVSVAQAPAGVAVVNVVPEVQAVVASAPVTNEVQTVTVAVDVTHEVQTITTSTTGVDEVQTISTDTADIVEEVQTITTVAVDVDEVQSLVVTGAAVPEVHKIRTYSTVAAGASTEIQIVQTYLEDNANAAADVNEVQTITLTSARTTQSLRIYGANAVTAVVGGGVNGGGATNGIAFYYGTTRIPTANAGAATNCMAVTSAAIKAGIEAVTGAGSTTVSAETRQDGGVGFQIVFNGVASPDALKFDAANDGCDVTCAGGTCPDGDFHWFSGALGGQFSVNFDSTNCVLCGVQSTAAPAVVALSGTGLDGVAVTDNMQAQLRALVNVNGNYVTVTRTDHAGTAGCGFTWSITFDGATLNGNVPEMTLGGITLVTGKSSGATLAVATAAQGSELTGTFTLSYPDKDSTPPGWSKWGIAGTVGSLGGPYDPTGRIYQTANSGASYTTAPIAFDAAQTALQNALTGTGAVRGASVLTALAASDKVNSRYWIITFTANDGDLAPLTCNPAGLGLKGAGVDLNMPTGLTAKCRVCSAAAGGVSCRDGDWLPAATGSTFVLNVNNGVDAADTLTFLWDSTAAEFEATLRTKAALFGGAAGATSGVVAVSRAPYTPVGVNWAGGFEWSVTFLAYPGNAPNGYFAQNTAVRGANSAVAVSVVTEGSQVSGTFTLSFNGGAASGAIDVLAAGNSVDAQGGGTPLGAAPFNANAGTNTLEAVLNTLIGAGAVTVTRTGSHPDTPSPAKFLAGPAGGWKYLITFSNPTTAFGNVPQLVVASQPSGFGSVTVGTVTEGNQLQGNFQIGFGVGGTLSAPINFNAPQADVETILKNMVSIDDTYLSVNRVVSPAAGAAQVLAYRWSITFVVNNDGVDHGADNWAYNGEPTYPALGLSKAWSMNTGPQPLMTCSFGATLTTTNPGSDATANKCVVARVTAGTLPLHGTFTITFNPTGCSRCSVGTTATSGALRWNAPPALNANGDSVQAALQAMPNVGTVSVTRTPKAAGGGSAGFAKTGAYVWSITFLTTVASTDSPGDVPTVSVTAANLLPGGATATPAELTRGRIVTGSFQLESALGSGTWYTVPAWESAANVEALLNTAPRNFEFFSTVRVSRSTVDKYGAYVWSVTFVENKKTTTTSVAPVPTGAGSVQILSVQKGTVLLNSDGNGPTVTVAAARLVTGSAPLSGVWTVNYKSQAVTPVVVASFAEAAGSLKLKLEGLSTLGTDAVYVTRTAFPSATSGGWGAVAVAPGTRGGYSYAITFLKNQGTYATGTTFPPGAGDVDPLQLTALAPAGFGSNLGGANAGVSLSATTAGSAPLAGAFRLGYAGAATADLGYGISGTDLATALPAAVTAGGARTVGGVRVSKADWFGQAVPGVTVSASRDAYTLTVAGGDLRAALAPGDIVRVGGSPTDKAGTNGDTLLPGTVSVTAGSATVTSSANLRPYVARGQSLRLNGDVYTVSNSGVQTTVIAVKPTATAFAAGANGGFKVKFNFGTPTPSACIPFDVSAATLETTLEALAVATGIGAAGAATDLTITATGLTASTWNAPATAGRLYTIYFEGSAYSGTDAVSTVANSGNTFGATVALDACGGTMGQAGTVEVNPTGNVGLAGLAANKLTLSSAWTGFDATGLAAYRLADTFAVQTVQYPVYTITVASANAINAGRLSAQFTGPLETACFDVTSADFAGNLAASLSQLALNGAAASPVYVKRESDGTANGLTFTFWFTQLAAMPAGFKLDVCTTGGLPLSTGGTIGAPVAVRAGAATNTFDATTLPLALVATPATAARWLGAAVTAVPIYKVSGAVWWVSFDKNLGNVGSGALSATASTGWSGGSVSVVDNVQQGLLPASYTIPSLATGVAYYVRVSATNKAAGSSSAVLGYGAKSSVASAVPSAAPGAALLTSVRAAVHVNEVQTVTTAARMLYEVQTITTAATPVSEVQAIQLSNTAGVTITGTNWALGLSDGVSTWMTDKAKQTVRVAAASGTLISGGWKLTGPSGASTCLAFDISAASLVTALTAAGGTGVLVARTGDASAGYVYTIQYTSADFTLTSSPGASPCATWAGGSSPTVTLTQLDTATADLDQSSTAAQVATEVGKLPPAGGAVNVVRSLADDQGGFRWTLAFVSRRTNLPQSTCTMTGAHASTLCGASTLTQGNTVGDGFTLTYTDAAGLRTETGKILFSASAADVVSALQSAVVVEASVSAADDQLGRTWTITFSSTPGNVAQLEPKSTLTGTGATVVPGTVTQGNALGGSFRLLFNGALSEPLAYNAPAMIADGAASVQARLQALTGMGAVNVVRSSAPDWTGGFSWAVTFVDRLNPGDVPLLIADGSGLTGVDAGVAVMETTKGSEASGTSLAVSWAHPASDGGDFVNKYKVQWDTTNWGSSALVESGALVTPELLYSVQTVTTAATNAAITGGSFQLSYRGELTALIPFDASAAVVRLALEALAGIDTVLVTRQPSRRLVSGTVSVSAGSSTMITSQDMRTSLNSAANAYPASYVYVAGQEFVALSAGASTSQLTLGSTSTLTASAFAGSGGSGYAVYGWGYGYSYTVTFVKVSGGPMERLRAPLHSLTPTAATPSVTVVGGPLFHLQSSDQGVSATAYAPFTVAQGCNACFYAGASAGAALTVGANYFVRVLPGNARGYSTAAADIVGAVAPKTVPGSAVVLPLVVVSASSLEVRWNPPTSNGGDAITSYTITWDVNAAFNSAAGALHGTAVVSGAAIAVTPPFSYVITGLNAVPYFVRMYASNSVPFQDIQGGVFNYNYPASTVSATPANLAPSAPQRVQLLLTGATRIRVIVTPPLRNGGVAIDAYKVDYDTRSDFRSVSNGPAGSETFTAAGNQISTLLSAAGEVVLDIGAGTPLSAGTAYYVRVSARNTVGMGATTAASSPLIPKTAPGAPAGVTLTTVAAQAGAPVTTATLRWTAPASTGGSPLLAYKVERWAATGRSEVQTVTVSATAGNFFVAFGGQESAQLAFNAPADTVRYELMRMVFTAGNPILTGMVVSRSNVGNVYTWSITFPASQGDAPEIQPRAHTDLAYAGGTATVAVSTLVQGVFPQAQPLPEVQMVVLRGGAAITGYFKLAFGGSSYVTGYIPAAATAAEVQAALELLPTIRQVSVSVLGDGSAGSDCVTAAAFLAKVCSVAGASAVAAPARCEKVTCPWGRKWMVTFTTNVGNQGALVVDRGTLASTSTFTLTAYDGDNAVSTTASAKGAPALGSAETRPGETPVEYPTLNQDQTVASGLSATLTGLTPGVTYYARVSASNELGFGAVGVPASVTVAPPVQAPDAPTAVQALVFAGDSTKLKVVWTPPVSNGGTSILSYDIQHDTTATFASAVTTVVRCPTWPDREVWEVALSRAGAVSADYFQLQLTQSGVTTTSARISYQAQALASGEAAPDVYSLDLTSNMGALQSKLNGLSNVGAGVMVSRTGSAIGTYTYSVTFQGDGTGWNLATVAGANTGVSVTRKVTGAAYATCGATVAAPQVIPAVSGTPLVQGTPYFIRVFARNSVGYSAAALAPGSQKPMKVPGVPTAAALSGVDSTTLSTVFGPPTDNGGDSITSYVLDYDVANTFNSGGGGAPQGSQTLTNLLAGAPFSMAIPGLTQGSTYFVRVKACNSQGCGTTTPTTPPSFYPHTVPSAPAAVNVGVTSATMITVGFTAPVNDGGAPVLKYKIEWDQAINFATVSALPAVRGVAEVLATTARYFTITGLTAGQAYFIRVAAQNDAGYGAFTTAPVSYTPAAQVAGKVTAATFTAGAVGSNQVTVTWAAPAVPSHGLYCGGGGPAQLAPSACPAGMGVGSVADGGRAITSYTLVVSESNTMTPITTQHSFTNVGGALSYTFTLTSTRTYFVQIFAVNSVGPGPACTNAGSLCTDVRLSAVPV